MKIKYTKLLKIRLIKKKKKKIIKNYLNTKLIYLDLKGRKKNNEFVIINNYRIFQSNFKFIKNKFYNKKYLKTTDIFNKASRIIIYKYLHFFKKELNTAFLKVKVIWSFLYTYNIFFLSFFNDLYYLTAILNKKFQRSTYYLILNFIKNKIFINFQDKKKNNFFFLSAGLFIKFFEKKKSFKKNKTIKLLMAKFMRKLFIISKIKETSLIVKKTPLFLIEFLTLLNTPIIHKFPDPIEKKTIEEKDSNKGIIKFIYFIFLQNIDFSLNKGPQKGRVKRKILRKIIINNKLID